MTIDWPVALSFVCAYCLGSVSVAVLVCRTLGQPDPRLTGSGNPGATNVTRAAGRWAGLMTLVGDVGKGFAALGLAQMFGVDQRWLGLVYLASLLGHMFPMFFGFRGGKGVAVGWGGLLYLELWSAMSVFVVWVLALIATRRVWIASLAAGLSSPFWLYWHDAPRAWIYAAAVVAVLVIVRHRGNWRGDFPHRSTAGNGNGG